MAAGEPTQKAAPVVMALKQFISGFVGIQEAQHRLDWLQLRRNTAASRATGMDSTAILSQPPHSADCSEEPRSDAVPIARSHSRVDFGLPTSAWSNSLQAPDR